MSRPTITIDAPELDDEDVENVQAFIDEISTALDSHYHQLYRLCCRPINPTVPDESKNPFIIIDALKLNDRGISHVRAFLFEITLAFLAHHYHQKNQPVMK